MACNQNCHKPRGRQCHCSGCHKTFTGVTVFDDHRRGNGICKDVPGITEKNGLWGTWGSTEGKRWWAK